MPFVGGWTRITLGSLAVVHPYETLVRTEAWSNVVIRLSPYFQGNILDFNLNIFIWVGSNEASSG